MYSSVSRYFVCRVQRRTFASHLRPAHSKYCTKDSVESALYPSLPAEAYTSPALYETERRSLLGPSWQLITHASLLPITSAAPATYFADTVANFPILLIRSARDGIIRGYHNVCRHKAAPLEHNGTGNCKLHGLKCKYHGWTYSIDGELRGTPHFNTSSCDPLEKDKFHLWPLRVAVWRGLVFAQILPTDSKAAMYGIEADALFAQDNEALVTRLTHNGSGEAQIPFEDFEFRSGKTYPLKCNWKVYVENYLEGYHIPVVHPTLNQQVDINKYNVMVRDGYIEHTSPVSDASAYAGVWLWHAPTLALNWYGDGLSLERIVPTSHNTTEIRYQYLFRKGTGSGDDSIDTSAQVTVEDIDICEAVQAGLEGGGYKSPGMLSPRHEMGVAYFQQMIRNTHKMK